MKIHRSFGIDLGTTNSTAAIVKEGKIIYGEEDVSKNKSIPSVIAIKRNNEEVVGTLAKNEYYSGNTNSKKSVKREMGKKEKVILGEKNYLPEEISSKIITYCKKCLLNTLGKEENVIYDRVVITIPAYFNLAQKNATKKAGQLAGLDVLMLLEEPTSAAINYALKNNVENGIFFVFDLGGGTFDVSILEKTGNIPQVLATAGNNFLGGDNFDFILARYFLDTLKKSGYDVENINVDITDNKFRMLVFAAENVKKQLSVYEQYDIYFPDIFKDNTGVELTIDNFTRDKFNELIKEKVEIDIIKESDKALDILEKKFGKTLNDITHILLVGGSTKIPYVKQVIKEKYCITEKLKDVISFEPDLSVASGSAYAADADGFIIEDEINNVSVKMNSSYSIDNNVYISGELLKGDIDEICINFENNNAIKTNIDSDKTFLCNVSEEQYTSNCSYSFYKNGNLLNKVDYDNNQTSEIIAPTPVQNETIAVEIIDIEKGKVEKYPIVESGEILPAESIEKFKINEYSNKKIILPIWEGPRKIFQLVIDLPENVKIGSLINVKTNIDMISNINLEVRLDGELLNGSYEYFDKKDFEEIEIEKLDTLFEERIDYVNDAEEKEKLLTQKENVKRELKEALKNNDSNHYTTVSEKYEKMVAELPIDNEYTEADFDKIGDKIKSMITPDVDFSANDVDNLVFHGKRFIKANNFEETKKCMQELEILETRAEMYSSPKKMLQDCMGIVATVIAYSENYVRDNPTTQLGFEIKKELDSSLPLINDIFQKYSNLDLCEENEEMKKDSIALLQLTAKLHSLISGKLLQDNSVQSLFTGLVSKS